MPPSLSTLGQQEEEIKTEILTIAIKLGWVEPTRRPKLPDVYPQEELRTCSICDEDLPAYTCLTLICGHIHCISCLGLNYGTALERPRNYPPVCCVPFDVMQTAVALTPSMIRDLLQIRHKKEAAAQTVCAFCKNELFDTTTHFTGDAAFCGKCKTFTCLGCRGSLHTGDCIEEPGAKQFRAMIKLVGWIECPSCSRVVEKIGGCNQIDCVCGTLFCYGCGNVDPHCICFHKRYVSPAVESDESSEKKEFKNKTPAPGELGYKHILDNAIKWWKEKQEENKAVLKEIQAASAEGQKQLKMAEEITALRDKLKKLREQIEKMKARNRRTVPATPKKRRMARSPSNVNEEEELIEENAPVSARTRSKKIKDFDAGK